MNSLRKLYIPVSKVSVAKNSTIDKLKATIDKCVIHADTPIHAVKDTELQKEMDELLNQMAILNSTNQVQYSNLYSYIKESFAGVPVKMHTVGGRVAGCTKGDLNTCNPQCAGSIKPHYSEGGAPCAESVLTMHSKKDIRIIHRGTQTSRSCKLFLIDIPRDMLTKQTVKTIKDNLGVDTMSVIVYTTQNDGHTEELIYDSENIDDIMSRCCGENGCANRKPKESGFNWWWLIILLIILIVLVILFCCFCRK